MAESKVKILFQLDPQDWHGHGGETLWAEHIEGSVWTKFRINNSPFFTKGISFLDIVCARPRADSLVFEFDRIVERGGHSTYMIIVDTEDELAKGGWSELEKMGCTYESMQINLSIGRKLLLSVDVPDSVEITKAHSIIAEGETRGFWLYQVGYTTFVDGSLPIT